MRGFLAAALLCSLASPCAMHASRAHDDGRFAGSALKNWFDHLASGKGLCCSFADGRSIADVDWGTHGDHYWVIVDGVRYAVPPEALVSEANKFGPAVVWPAQDENGAIYIRCFMPGAAT